MAKRKSGKDWPDWDVLDPGEERIPEARRHKVGDVVWLIGDPPARAEVALDTGHPRWLKTSGWTSEGEMIWLTSRKSLRTSRRRAAAAMLAGYRAQVRELQSRMAALAREHGLP